MLFVAGRAHGAAARQAREMADKVLEFLALGGQKVEIEVKSEETAALRKRVTELEAQLGIIPSGFVVDEI